MWIYITTRVLIIQSNDSVVLRNFFFSFLLISFFYYNNNENFFYSNPANSIFLIKHTAHHHRIVLFLYFKNKFYIQKNWKVILFPGCYLFRERLFFYVFFIRFFIKFVFSYRKESELALSFCMLLLFVYITWKYFFIYFC